MKTRRQTTLQILVPSITLALGWTPSCALAQAPTLKPTPHDALGPFYPESWAGDVDHDLATYQGRVYAKGTPLNIVGKLLSTSGEPIRGARIEIWQTDEKALYRHAGSDGEGPATRGFQGFGFATTDADGRYRFRTIKPVVYGGRPAHVHLKVVAAGHRDLITQMYFAGENTDSGGFARLTGGFSTERARLTVKPTSQRVAGIDTLLAEFDVVLERRAEAPLRP